MLEIRQTAVFIDWLSTLRDADAATKIAARLLRVAAGNFGDVKSVGDGVSELRVNHGPGYRVYFTKRGLTVIVLLCGGDKSTQDRDIKAARRLAQEV